jgi:hypothetical protein
LARFRLLVFFRVYFVLRFIVNFSSFDATTIQEAAEVSLPMQFYIPESHLPFPYRHVKQSTADHSSTLPLTASFARLLFHHDRISFQAYLIAGDFSVPFNLSQARVNAALAESKAAAKAAAESRDAPPSKAESTAVKSSTASDAAAASSLAAEMLRNIPQVALFFSSSPVCQLR